MSKKSRRPNRKNRAFRLRSSGDTLWVDGTEPGASHVEVEFSRAWGAFAFLHGATFLHVERASDVDDFNTMFSTTYSFMWHRMRAVDETLIARYFAAEGNGEMVTLACWGELFDIYGSVISVTKNGVEGSFWGWTIHRHGSDVRLTPAELASYIPSSERVFA